MKIPLKIVLINVSIAIIISIFYVVKEQVVSEMALVVGLTFLVVGLIALVAGIFLLFLQNKEYAQGFLISGGLLLLLGFLTCGAGIGL